VTRCATCETLPKRCKDCVRRANSVATAKWRAKNPERMKAMVKAWDAAHPEKKLEASKRRQKRFPHLMVEAVARRRAAKYQATPVWADRKAIKQYYLIAEFLTAELGVPFSVDHVVPLRGETVCGLHAQTNLSILPTAWNAKKGNRTWPGKP
jgi:hypothetical protein